MAKKWSKELYINDGDGGMLLAQELLKTIRPQDEDDLVASGGDIIFEICGSIQGTEQTYIYRGENGELLCVMGISGYISEAPGRCVFMLGTEAINDISYYKQLLITEAKKVIEEWVGMYGLIFNAVNVENEKSIRWLTRLGARWLPEEIVTSKGTFKQFVIMKGE